MKINKTSMNHKYSMKNPKHQMGVTMLELSVVLIIAAILSAAVFISFRDNTRKNETLESVSKVTTTAGNLRKNFGVNNLYGSVTTAVAVQSRTIPEDQRITGTNTAQNIFGGLVTVAPVTLTQANDAAALSWANVSPNSCSELVLGTAATARRITVGATVVKPTDAAVNIVNLNTACDVAAPMAIIWDIGRTGS